MECDHRNDYLVSRIEGPARGGVARFQLHCKWCGKSWHEEAAVLVSLNALAREIEHIWKEVCKLGGSREKENSPKTPPGPIRQAAECQHYTSWLKVVLHGEGMRGRLPSFTVKCAGCSASWGPSAGAQLLYERLSAEQREIKKAIEGLRNE